MSVQPSHPSQATHREHEGLIQSLRRNDALRRKLGAMPADMQTLTLSIAEDKGEPLFHAGGKTPLAQRTLEQSPAAPAAEPPPPLKSWVPLRRLATVSQKSGDEVDYRIVGQLGSGGTGVVYQAHQRAIDREVALKMLRRELSGNAVSRERFLAEARVIGGLDHPNVIALHEVCVDESGGLFYSMKRIDGTSWNIQIGELKRQQNLDILLRVADAIRYAHSRGLVHRDIKPENVMLGRFGEVLLADWGLAISHSGDESSDSLTGSIGGTPAYMAPELARGAISSINFQTDVYLLGAVLFEILTGFPPHRGKTLLSCIEAAANNEIRPSDVEGELMDIAMTAMATDPSDRFASVEELIDAIRDQRQHDESTRLVRRAQDRMKQADGEHQYEDYRVADALLMEALDIWPGNKHARKIRRCLQVQFARAAAAAGDLDLAISLFESAGQGHSPEASIARAKRDHRDSSERRISRYSALFTHSPDAGLLIEMSSGKVVEANAMFASLLGYSRDEVVGRAIGDLNLWACPERRTQLVDALRRDGAINEFEARFLRRDGEPIDVLISGRLVELDGTAMVVSTIRDISLRKKAENELKKSRERLREIQRLAGVGSWSYDVQTRQVTWSEEAFRLAGRDPKEGVPTTEEYIEMIHPEDRPQLQQAMRDSVLSGAAYDLIVRQKRADGNYARVLMRGQPIFDEDGNTTEVYGVLICQRTE